MRPGFVKIKKPLFFFRKSGFAPKTKKPRVLGARGLYLLFLKDTERQTPKYYYEYQYVANNKVRAAG